MSRLRWPEACVLICAGLPAFVFSMAVLCAFPAVILPVLGIAGAAWLLLRRQARHDAIAARCAAEHPFAAALVAQRLPDMPTVPMRSAYR
jgi:hypothetical protein